MPTMPALALVLLLVAASIAASQAGTICIDSPASPSPSPAPPTSNSINSRAFDANVLTLMNALLQAAAPTGFASLSLGAGRDRAFVRGLCRGDSTPSECLASLQGAIFDPGASECASSRSAAFSDEQVLITFADTNATINYYYEKRSLEVLYSTLRVSDPGSFDRTYNVLMKRLVTRAASASAMFATGEAVYAPSDPKGTMYGLVQCMRDLSAAE